MTATLNPTMQRVIALIRRHGSLSRAEIADELGLSRSAITQAMRPLEKDGWVEEHSVGGNHRGQPKQNLRLRARAAISLGVFIQNDRITLLLADLNGQGFATGIVTPTPKDPQDACKQIAAEARELLRAQRIGISRVLAVGVVTTGLFLDDNREAIWTPVEMKAWRGFRLRDALAAELECPVLLENDGNAAALAEAMNGAGKRHDTFFYLYLAYGVGGGFIHRGELFHGGFGNAAEVGLLIPHHPAVRPSLSSLAAQLGRSHGSITTAEIESLFENRDAAFMRFLDKAVKALEDPLVSVVALFNPKAIVVGGKFPRCVLQHIAKHIDITNQRTGQVPDLPQPEIVTSEIQNIDAGLLGAALLPLQNTFGASLSKHFRFAPDSAGK